MNQDFKMDKKALNINCYLITIPLFENVSTSNNDSSLLLSKKTKNDPLVLLY